MYRNLLFAVSALPCIAFAPPSLAQPQGMPPIPAGLEACRDGIENIQHMAGRNDARIRVGSSRVGVNLNVYVIDCTDTSLDIAVFIVLLSNRLTEFEERPDIEIRVPDGVTLRPETRSINAQAISFYDNGGELWARIRDDRRFTVEATLTQPGRHAFRFEPREVIPPGELLGQRAIDWRETKSWFAGGERIVVRRTVRQMPHVYWRVPADRGEGFDFWYDFDNDEVPDTFVTRARGGAMRGQLFWDSNMDRRPDTAFRNPYDLPSPLDMPPDPA